MIFLLLVAVGLWSIGSVMYAEGAPGVIINEIMWAKAEYIELFNSSGEEVSMDGWYISRQKPDVDGAGQSEEVIVTFGASDTLPAHEHFLIESSESATSISSNKIKNSLGLIDGGVLLRLRAQDGSLVDSANHLGNWFAGENNAVDISMERNSPSSAGEMPGSWHSSVGSIGGRIGTPQQENSELTTPGPTISPGPTVTPAATPTPVITPTTTPTAVIPMYLSNVYINEFLPNPLGDDTTEEFIELFNDGGESVDISGWVLDDVGDAGSSPFTVPEETVIAGKGYMVFLRPQTKISMNNDVDHVRLVRPDGITQDDIGYTDTKEGYSYNRISLESYEKSSTITPGALNIITVPATPTPKISTASEEERITYDFSSKIFINEALPNPIGEDTDKEFIELKSEETRNINLFGWALDDGLGGSAPYHFKEEDSISSGKIIVFFRSKTKIALNNDEDVIRLMDPNEKIVSLVSYKPKVVEGQSYNKTPDDSFVWSDTNTPGKENTIFAQEKESPSSEPKPGKKVSTPKRKVTNQKSITSPAKNIPRVLSALTSVLPWPQESDGTVIRTIVGSPEIPMLPERKQVAFVFLGVTVAALQGWSGFSHKEKIWQK